MVKNTSAIQELQETQVQSLDQEDPLEQGMANYSSILAWKIHGQRILAGHNLWVAKSETRLKQLTTHTHTIMSYRQEVGVWAFKKKEDNSQEEEDETITKQMFPIRCCGERGN